ncbi:MAG: SPOR domain-containing protein [Alistipes sp.]|nr:SPOR domain-containing protein [Candidatus Alistipes equi]
MKRFITLLGILLFLGSLSAQNLHEFSRKIGQREVDSLGRKHGIIRVEERGDVSSVIQSAISENVPSVLSMRVVVYMGNGQQARQESIEAKESVLSLYPELQVDMVYENPYFKVIVGDCRTREEAVALLAKLQSSFPKAFVTRERIMLQR